MSWHSVAPGVRRRHSTIAVSPFEQVFGRSRLNMPTTRHVEVVREEAAPGERRRYAKRFLATAQGDFGPWTARESRVLAHLIERGARCVPELVGANRGDGALSTFDAGVTVEQWVTLLRVERDGRVLPHAFADCAHWWALAHHLLRALETLHVLHVVHLDIKADNVCVPALLGDVAVGSPAGLKFARLAVIDFAFALSPVEPLALALPIGAQPDYPYQSPRLLEALAAGRAGDLRATQALDWRCDLYSLAAMLRLYLPSDDGAPSLLHDGWTRERHARALALVAALDDAHDREVQPVWPHRALIEMCEAAMQEVDLVESLLHGFTLASADAGAPGPCTPLTCLVAPQTIDRAETVVKPPIQVVRPRTPALPVVVAAQADTPASRVGPMQAWPVHDDAFAMHRPARLPRRRFGARSAVVIVWLALVCAAAVVAYLRDGSQERPVIAAAAGAAGSHAASARAAQDAGPASAQPEPSNAAAGSPAVIAATSVKRPSGESPVDADTVRRAADAESVDAPSAQPRETPPEPPPGTSTTASTPAVPATPSGQATQAQLAPARAANETASQRAALEQPSSGPTSAKASAQVARSRSAAPPAVERASSDAPPPPRPAVPAAKSVAPDDAAIATVAPAVEDVAARTERDVARVLTVAAKARDPAAEQEIMQVARSIRPVSGAPHGSAGSPGLARRLNAQARAAWERQDIDTALRLQQRAFRANPNDAEVTGNLAFYYLKARPAQPAMARRLALYALAARGRTFPAGRVQDWGTLAVASSLEGRQADAAKALYVMLSVSGNPEWACRAARLAVAQYGPAMQGPAQAMLGRVHERGGAAGAPSCG